MVPNSPQNWVKIGCSGDFKTTFPRQRDVTQSPSPPEKQKRPGFLLFRRTDLSVNPDMLET